MSSVNSPLTRLNILSGKQTTLSIPCRPIKISGKCLFGISNGFGEFYRQDDDEGIQFGFHCSLEGDWPRLSGRLKIISLSKCIFFNLNQQWRRSPSSHGHKATDCNDLPCENECLVGFNGSAYRRNQWTGRNQ